MKLFLLCFAQTIFYTLGVLVICGLSVEICYRLCFILMGKRAGRLFWFVTSFIGTPVHEGGHALMCLLFAHRIEALRLVPTRTSGAMVEHSYSRRNPYAVFGNLWIGLGPIFSGLGVILTVLYLVYPESMHAYHAAVDALMDDGASIGQVKESVELFLRGLLTEQTRAVWVRLLSALVLFSLALHVRLSAADVAGMLSGLPTYAVLAALVSLVATLIGEEAVASLGIWLRQAAWLIISLFSLILLFGLVQLVMVALYRLLYALLLRVRAQTAPASEHYTDYRDRDWKNFED